MIMIEKIVYDFLTEKMSVPVYMEVPQNPPTRMVIVEKTGSSLDEYIYTSTFAIQSYGKSLLDAAELNDMLVTAMLDGVNGLVSLDKILRVDLNSDYNFTDTTTKKYRYQAIIIVTHY